MRFITLCGGKGESDASKIIHFLVRQLGTHKVTIKINRAMKQKKKLSMALVYITGKYTDTEYVGYNVSCIVSRVEIVHKFGVNGQRACERWKGCCSIPQ